MKLSRRSERTFYGLVALSALCLSACGSGSDVPTGDGAEHLRRLAIEFSTYRGTHRGQTPKDEAAFRKYLENSSSQERDIDDMLTSPRDGQPYMIRYGINVPIPSPEVEQPVIIYEQTGADGTRYVAFGTGGVNEVTEEEFQQLLPDAG